MTQLVRFVDRPGGTVLMDVSPLTVGVQVGSPGLEAPPPPVRRTVSDNPAVDGGTISAAPYGLRTVKLPLVYTAGVIATPQAQRRTDVTALMRLLNQERIWLEVRPDGISESRYLWLYRPDTETLTKLQGLGDKWAEVTCTFLADPFALGPKESLGTLSTTVAGDLQTTITGSTIKGDAAAPLIVTATSAGGGAGGAGPKPVTLFIASKVGGAAHDCLLDVAPFSVGTLPGASTNTTVVDATAVGGSVRRWANVSAGQEWVAATGALFTTPGGGNDAKLAGSYRVFAIVRGGATDTDGNTWEAELRLVTPAGWSFQSTETKLGRVAAWVSNSTSTPDMVVDLGVVEFPFGGRPLAPSFDAAAALAPAQLKLYLRHPLGTTDDLDVDALLWLPADDTFMAMQYADGGTARTFTADPYTGRVVVQQAGVAVSDAARVQYQGAPPNVVPGVDVTLCAANVNGGLGKGTAATVTSLPATFTAAYWPRYLTVA